MTDREAMRLALEALERSMEAGMTGIKVDQAITALRQALAEPDMGIDRGAWDDVPDATKWVDELRGGDETEEEEEPVACKHNRYSVDVHEQTGTCYDCGAEGRMRFVIDDTAPPKQPECNKHPDAPHGFNRESSHSLGRYVCDCEGWEPEEQEPVAWRNAAIRLGEDLYSVGPNGYYNMTASQWLDWALSVINTAPPKPAQDLIVGYADSHDITSDGHDFWVSREPGKNTVPLYLYGHPPKIWQGLTDEDIAEGAKQSWVDKQAFESAVWWAEEKLRDKNGF